MSDFQRELATLLNRYTVENASDTPDFVLASYLAVCLQAFADAVNERERWYGREPRKHGEPIELET